MPLPSFENTILAIGAHHDDNEQFAGTLAHYKQAGWNIVSVVMCNGMYSAGQASEATIPVRDAESLAAAKLLGMTTVFLRLHEGDLANTQETRLKVIEAIRQHRPQIVITHPPRDYHSDHIATSQCVHDATLMCNSYAVLTASPACRQPRLYYCDTWFVPFEPDCYVDITEHIELKLQMMACHKSQLPPKPVPGDTLDRMRLRSRMRGIEAGAEYAEAFRFVPRLGSVRTGLLLT